MDQYFSKTLERGLTILTLFDRDHTRLSLSEIYQSTDINKPSAYRLTNTLVKMGYLKKISGNKLLKLGPKSIALGQNFIQGFELLQATQLLIDKTYADHEVTIGSALLDGYSLISLYKREVFNTIYFRQPLIMKDLYARAMGKAVLAQMSQKELKHYFKSVSIKKHTPKTKDKIEDMMADLEETRNRGYSVNDEEYMVGLICIGAPLMNYQTNTVVGAISFDFPISEQSLNSIERNYIGTLTKLASDISDVITVTES